MLRRTRDYERHHHRIGGIEARLAEVLDDVGQAKVGLLGSKQALNPVEALLEKALAEFNPVADDKRELCEEAVREIEDAD